jgi:pyruvate,orthophosphate dikinase
MQRADFVDLFEIMKGLPVTIRLLDPPLHEFLPHSQSEIEEVARAMNTDARKIAIARVNSPSSTRCSASVAAAWRSPIRKSRKCRRAIFEAAVKRASAPASRSGLR